MKCQSCGKPATVHLTNLVKGQKQKIMLCQECAERQHLVTTQQLNLPAILETLIGHHVGQASDALSRLACPVCGIKYMEFRAEGRLGCPHDYTVFRSALGPLLQRIHRAERHVGKAPTRRPAPAAVEGELDLRRRLRAAVEAEQYEEAARLRDLLRHREATDEPG